MRAARMHGYQQPLVLERVKTPEVADDEVLVKVEAAGICRTDFQLSDGYFREFNEPVFTVTPGTPDRSPPTKTSCSSLSSSPPSTRY